MVIVNRFTGCAPVMREWRRSSLGANSWELRWKPVCTSTEIELSNWLREKPLNGDLSRAFVASRQNRGRGQNGKYWHSPSGGVWISAAFPISNSKNSAGLIGLAVAVALAQRLNQFNIPVRIKWPNDLLIGGKKLAGLLPSLVHRGSHVRFGRVGVGLNVCNPVPIGGISLEKVLKPVRCNHISWTSEVLLSLENAFDLVAQPEYVCAQAERILWARHVLDPKTGLKMCIEGLDIDGALKVTNGSSEYLWRRW